ncbi:MAG TPA: cellulase family glycosylhydrolase, partial [Candidatus Acidoferrum sp.]|nr:cellulase family glycosylhydrolase [Candidatus Acidoferrum sp.]
MVAQLRAKLTAPLLCFLLLATLAGCSLIPTNGLSPTSNLALPAPMMLSQVGSRPVIVPTAANKPALHLMGATVWGLPADIDQQHEGFGEAQYAQRTTVLQTLKNWGANAIRLRLDVSAMQGGAGLTQAQYIQHVVDWVREATAQNLYVNICFWDSLYNANNKWFGGYKQDFNFMRTVYAALGNNPRVVYEPWNEPNG